MKKNTFVKEEIDMERKFKQGDRAIVIKNRNSFWGEDDNLIALERQEITIAEVLPTCYRIKDSKGNIHICQDWNLDNLK